jgi:hypothetical protein
MSLYVLAHKEPFIKEAGTTGTAAKYLTAQALDGTTIASALNAGLNLLPWAEKHDTLWGRFSDKDVDDLAEEYQKQWLEETGDAAKAAEKAKSLRRWGVAANIAGMGAEAVGLAALTGGMSTLATGAKAVGASAKAAKTLSMGQKALTYAKAPITFVKGMGAGKALTGVGKLGQAGVNIAAKHGKVMQIGAGALNRVLGTYAVASPIAKISNNLNEAYSNGETDKRSAILDRIQTTADTAPLYSALPWGAGWKRILGSTVASAGISYADPIGYLRSRFNPDEVWRRDNGLKKERVAQYNELKPVIYRMGVNPEYRADLIMDLGLDPKSTDDKIKSELYRQTDMQVFQSAYLSQLYSEASVTEQDTPEQVKAKLSQLSADKQAMLAFGLAQEYAKAGRTGHLPALTASGLLTPEQEQQLLKDAYKAKFRLTDFRYSNGSVEEPTSKVIANRELARDPNLADATANVASNVMAQPSGTENVSATNQHIAAQAFLSSIKTDPNKAFEYLERIGKEGQQEAAELSPELKALFQEYMTAENAAEFIAGLNDDNFKKCLFYAQQTANAGFFAQLDPSVRNRFTKAAEAECQKRIKARFKEDPLGTAPLLVGAWLNQKGVVSSDTAQTIANPFVFYGSILALLIGVPLIGSFLSGLGGGGNNRGSQNDYPNEGYKNLDAYAQRMRGGAAF